MSKVFVSFDYENDKHYKYLLEGWHEHPRFDFVFDDGTPTEIDSFNVGRIKAALTQKVNLATYTLVIVGEYANQRHRNSSLIGYRNWINFEIARSIENNNHIVAVILKNHFELPDVLRSTNYTPVYGFSESGIMQGLNSSSPSYGR